MTENEKAFAEAKTLFPGGVNSPVRAFARVGGTPKFFKKTRGAIITDIEGKKFIDFNGAWGSLIFGHAPRAIISKAMQRARHGSSFGAPCLEEIELANQIRDKMPSLERLRFVSTGTEAVMSALRLARAFTGRNLILKFDGCYHGHHDSLLISAGSGLLEGIKPDSAGVPDLVAGLTISIPYNDIHAVERIFFERGKDIAAIVVEPVAANMGLVLPQSGFLEGLRTISQAHGALLIFDEVITGFRLGLGGAQERYKIVPDLTTLGKIMGGGFVAAAFGGRREIMDLLAPLGPVYQAGTLSGNPVAMKSGAETLRRLKSSSYTLLEETCLSLVESLQTKFPKLSFPTIASMFSIFGSAKPPCNWYEVKASDTEAYCQVFNLLLKNGIYISPSPFETSFISLAHTKTIMKKFRIILERINV